MAFSAAGWDFRDSTARGSASVLCPVRVRQEWNDHKCVS